MRTFVGSPEWVSSCRCSRLEALKVIARQAMERVGNRLVGETRAAMSVRRDRIDDARILSDFCEVAGMFHADDDDFLDRAPG